MDQALTYLGYALAIPGVASIVAAVMPRPAAGTKFEALFRLLDLVAGNWLNARNAPKQ